MNKWKEIQLFFYKYPVSIRYVQTTWKEMEGKARAKIKFVFDYCKINYIMCNWYKSSNTSAQGRLLALFWWCIASSVNIITQFILGFKFVTKDDNMVLSYLSFLFVHFLHFLWLFFSAFNSSLFETFIQALYHYVYLLELTHFCSIPLSCFDLFSFVRSVYNYCIAREPFFSCTLIIVKWFFF